MHEGVNEVWQRTLPYREFALEYNMKTPTLEHRVKTFKAGVSTNDSSHVSSIPNSRVCKDFLWKKRYVWITLYLISAWCQDAISRQFKFGNLTYLSLRKQENPSAARSFAFNKTALTDFSNKSDKVLEHHNFNVDWVFNFWWIRRVYCFEYSWSLGF